MASTRPLVSVWQFDQAAGVTKPESSVPLPYVYETPIRPDLVNFVHTNMAKNTRQPYAVKSNAGYQTAAESWGTGRAVSRIPRVPGGGTHRSGQGAFGNMCRGGGMFSPTKIYRRWHRKTNMTMKRHAVASAIAASGIPGLVMARGHRVDNLLELPLVLSDGLQSLSHTKTAVNLFKGFGLGEEILKVQKTKKIRTGKGKARNRRYKIRKGPLVVYGEDAGLRKGIKNLLGFDMCRVDNLNLLQLAPGGVMGRLVIWTQSAFEKLNDLFGTDKIAAPAKKKYHVMRPLMTNADLAAIINSDAIQSVLNPAKMPARRIGLKKNPFTNLHVANRLNPAAAEMKKKRKLDMEKMCAAKKQKK
eukprot:GHVL01034172.1.p1 GENE.GHVL01034172.1~~GHVL01034172.1.p1  ORF type:complete len:359 (+),score=53.39 GHVL01034172.1:41-1117(+)